MDAVRRFPGERYDRAVFYPEDDAFSCAATCTSTTYEVVGNVPPTGDVRSVGTEEES